MDAIERSLHRAGAMGRLHIQLSLAFWTDKGLLMGFLLNHPFQGSPAGLKAGLIQGFFHSSHIGRFRHDC
jgi:hypothetical protein